MDARQFDALARTLTTPGGRRELLAILAALPLLSALLSPFAGEAEGKGRRKRRKKKHKHSTGDRKKNRKGKQKRKGKNPDQGQEPCQPEPASQTCAGTCGTVQNSCQQAVECGPCGCDPPCGPCATCSNDLACEACDPCCDDVCCAQEGAICHADTGACCVPGSNAQTCNGQCGTVLNTCGISVDCGPCICSGNCAECKVCDETTATCVPDPAVAGDVCGDGQVCRASGNCHCNAASCGACRTCGGDGACIPCAGCCDGFACQPGGSNAACGKNGQTCDVCGGQEECQDHACVCRPDCAGKACGPDGCGAECGACTPPETCGGGGAPDACGCPPDVCGCTPTTCAAQGKDCGTISDGCDSFLHCGSCGGETPMCVNNVCRACSGRNPCPGSQLCCAGACFSGDCCDSAACSNPTPLCVDNICTACSASTPCPSNQICVDGACEACDVCADGQVCPYTSVQAAVADSNGPTTIHVCPGEYRDRITIARNLSLIGGGDGPGVGSPGLGDTVLDPISRGRVVTINTGVTATLQALRISNGRPPDNPDALGGGGVRNFGTLTLTDCTITGNTNRGDLGVEEGGGIFNAGGGNLNVTRCSIFGNTAEPYHLNELDTGKGGGLFNQGTATVTTSAFFTNTAVEGGGVYNNGGTLTMQENSQVSTNTATSRASLAGGGIFNNGGTVTLLDSHMVSGNDPNDCVGTISGESCG